MIKLPSLFEEEAFKACEISCSLDWNRNSFTYSPCININLKSIALFCFPLLYFPFFVEKIAGVLNNFRSSRIVVIDDSLGICSWILLSDSVGSMISVSLNFLETISHYTSYTYTFYSIIQTARADGQA